MDVDIDTETTFKASSSLRVYQRFLTVRQHCRFVCLAIGVGTNLPVLLRHNSLLLWTWNRDDIPLPRIPAERKPKVRRRGAESADPGWRRATRTAGEASCARGRRSDGVQVPSLSNMYLPFLRHE